MAKDPDHPDFEEAIREIGNALPLRKIQSYLDQLNTSSDVKALLRDIATLTVTLAGRVYDIGRKIISFAIEICRRFPNTIFGVVVALILSALISSIPLIGPALAAALMPLLLALGIAAGAVNDMLTASIRAEVTVMSQRLAALEKGI